MSYKTGPDSLCHNSARHDWTSGHLSGEFHGHQSGPVNAARTSIGYQTVLSDDAVITSGDTVLDSGSFSGPYSYVTSLTANSSRNITRTITLPGGIVAGNYYIGVIIDYDNRHIESDENNNTRSSALIVQ